MLTPGDWPCVFELTFIVAAVGGLFTLLEIKLGRVGAAGCCGLQSPGVGPLPGARRFADCLRRLSLAALGSGDTSAN